MFEYKIHTQRDKTFSGAFEPTEFEAALNAYAADGWRLAEGFMAALEGHAMQPTPTSDAVIASGRWLLSSP